MVQTYTRDRTSKRAAPSLRSETVATDLARLKVAKKLKNASISFRCCWEESVMVQGLVNDFVRRSSLESNVQFKRKPIQPFVARRIVVAEGFMVLCNLHLIDSHASLL